MALPMELWAHVAFFLPFESLLDTFWALRRSGLLPATGTSPSNALLQFCSEQTGEAAEPPLPPPDEHLFSVFTEMGFSCALVERAHALCGGNAEAMLEYLVRMTN